MVREITALLTYEATQDLTTVEVDVETPLATTICRGRRPVGLVPVLRAGWAWSRPRSTCSLRPGLAYRPLPRRAHAEAHLLLQPLPDVPTVDTCLVLDPMLATAGSATATVEMLKHWGATRIKYMGLIAAPEGSALPRRAPDVPIHVAAVDSHLNEHGYIVPGLGDAGDRQFGTG